MKDVTSRAMGKILLLLTMMLLMPWAEADANYYYKLQLKDAGNAEASATWTGWIHVEAELDEANKVKNWKNSLKKLIIDKESVKDESDNDVKLYESSTATERKYTVVGIAFKGDGSVGSDGWKNQILDGEDYQYTVNEDGKDKVIPVFPVIKPEIEHLDLSEWGKLFYEGSYYFSGMKRLKKVTLPNNEFAIRSVGLFSSNDNLEELEWGTNTFITEIGQEAFSSCPKLKAEYIQKAINQCAAYNLNDNNKPGYNYESMTDEDKAEFFKEHGTYENIKYGVIGKMAFHDCMQTGGTTNTLKIPEGIVEIGEKAFDQTQDGTHLKTVKFEGKDIKIDDYAFDGCRDVEDLTLEQNVKVIHLGKGVFRNNRMIKSASVNGILKNFSVNCASKDKQGEVSIPAQLFEGCNGNTKGENGNTVFKPNFTELVIPANVKFIGACAFGSRDGAGTMFLKKITVSRGTAPKTDDYYTDGGEGWSWDFYPFNDLIANQCTIIFKGDAAKYNSDDKTGYKSYMTDGQEFQRLLTKDIYSDNSDAAKAYNVVAQQHAIVRLHRSLVPGWNTLCLPFGVTNASADAAGGADVRNSSIIKNALNLSKSTDNNTFMIALYRDYVPSKDLLRFLHITDANTNYTYANAEIPAYQPFMVKMGSNDLAATDGEYFINRQSHKDAFYIFNNVDLNYAGWTVDGENNYTANISETPAPSEWKGQSESFAPFNDGKGNTNTYAFVGSFNTSIITPSAETNDYFIQTNSGITKFYKYESGKKYGVRAFSGWFKYVGSKGSADAKPASVLINIMGDNYETTEIVRVDADGNESVTGNIYNINGQLVRANATGTEGLQKGIYIMNGKKFVVK